MSEFGKCRQLTETPEPKPKTLSEQYPALYRLGIRVHFDCYRGATVSADEVEEALRDFAAFVDENT